MSVSRWDPFQDLLAIQDEMNQVFGRARQGQGGRVWAPALDISERKDAYVVTVDLPGVKPADLDITLEDGLLTIQGVRHISRERPVEENAPSSPQGQLEQAYLDLLREVEPRVADSEEFAEEFARRLAAFTKVWAQDPDNPTALDKQERELLQWLAQQPTQSQAESTEEEFHRVERRYGSFRRSITLPRSVRADAIEATFENGVLEVVMPKAEEAKPKRIAVRAGSGSRQQVQGTSRY